MINTGWGSGCDQARPPANTIKYQPPVCGRSLNSSGKWRGNVFTAAVFHFHLNVKYPDKRLPSSPRSGTTLEQEGAEGEVTSYTGADTDILIVLTNMCHLCNDHISIAMVSPVICSHLTFCTWSRWYHCWLTLRCIVLHLNTKYPTNGVNKVSPPAVPRPPPI